MDGPPSTIIWGRQMAKVRASRAVMTRRAVLLVGYAQDSARRNADATETDGAHPTPAPGRTPTASPAPGRPRPVSTSSARARLAKKDQVRTRVARTGPRAARRGHRRDADGLPMVNVHDGPKVIALTIDDGPSPVYTPQILRLLDQYQVTATFSMIGLQVDAHPGVAREVAAAGHTIANHTWSHLDLAVLPPVAVIDQMNRATGAKI